jgi:hypothetical protein
VANLPTGAEARRIEPTTATLTQHHLARPPTLARLAN